MPSRNAALQPPLQFQLDEITAHTRALVQPERLARAERMIRDLEHTGIAEHMLAVGEPAPSFSLPAASGKMVHSRDLLALGPVIIKFFRGRWDPYDVTELEVWEQMQERLRAQKALFIAISPQTTRQNMFLLEQHGFSYPVLSDAGCRIAHAFRAAYTVNEDAQPYYRSLMVNLPYLNGDSSWTLPLPATFVLKQEGTISFAQGHADYRKRPDPELILAHLNSAGR